MIFEQEKVRDACPTGMANLPQTLQILKHVDDLQTETVSAAFSEVNVRRRTERPEPLYTWALFRSPFPGQ